MTTPYIPQTDAGFAAWSANFDTLITATPTAYGLTAPQAAAYAALEAIWVPAFAAATNPSTRTPVTVAAKDTAKANSIALARELAQIVKADPDTTDEQLVELGITVDKFPPTPVPTPTTFPLLDFLRATPGQHHLQWRDSETPTVRRKPEGATAMELWQLIGTEPAPTPAGSAFVSDYTKTPFVVDHLEADAGKIATYFGRWKTRTGLVGPWSVGVSFEIGW
jgi:hypothetical protein